MAKVLYKFTINKLAEIEEEKTETVKNEAGEDVIRTYKEKVKKEVPVEIEIRQPSRRQMQDADMEFSVEMSRCIKSGILTKAMLLNKYSDTGGLISDSDAKAMLEAADTIRELNAKISILNLKPEAERSEDEKKELSLLAIEHQKMQKALIEKETSYITLFNHTADIKAQNRAILWYILNLTYFKDASDKDDAFKPMFPGKTFEEKEAVMFDFEDSRPEIFDKSYSKVASIVSYWFFTGTSKETDFNEILEDINNNDSE